MVLCSKRIRNLDVRAGGWRPVPQPGTPPENVYELLTSRRLSNQFVNSLRRDRFADAAGGGWCLFPLLPLLLGIGMQRQCMNGSRQLFSQHSVDLTMTPQQPLSFKRLAHHHHLEVALGARCHPVHVAFVDHFQMAGDKAAASLASICCCMVTSKTPKMDVRPL